MNNIYKRDLQYHRALWIRLYQIAKYPASNIEHVLVKSLMNKAEKDIKILRIKLKE